MELAVSSFWSWFRDNERRYRTLTMPRDADLLDELEVQLHRVAPRLGFLISQETDPQGRHELVLTTHGQGHLEPAVRALAAAAPELPGWVVVAFQQPKGFDFTHRDWDRGLEFDPRAMQFLPTMRRSDPAAFGVRVVTAPRKGVTLDALRVAVHRILAAGLGDEAYARIDHVDVGFAEPSSDDLFPLPDLPRCMRWRDERRSPPGA